MQAYMANACYIVVTLGNTSCKCSWWAIFRNSFTLQIHDGGTLRTLVIGRLKNTHSLCMETRSCAYAEVGNQTGFVKIT